MQESFVWYSTPLHCFLSFRFSSTSRRTSFSRFSTYACNTKQPLKNIDHHTVHTYLASASLFHVLIVDQLLALINDTFLFVLVSFYITRLGHI
jgi:hypothetical protein